MRHDQPVEVQAKEVVELLPGDGPLDRGHLQQGRAAAGVSAHAPHGCACEPRSRLRHVEDQIGHDQGAARSVQQHDLVGDRHAGQRNHLHFVAERLHAGLDHTVKGEVRALVREPGSRPALEPRLQPWARIQVVQQVRRQRPPRRTQARDRVDRHAQRRVDQQPPGELQDRHAGAHLQPHEALVGLHHVHSLSDLPHGPSIQPGMVAQLAPACRGAGHRVGCPASGGGGAHGGGLEQRADRATHQRRGRARHEPRGSRGDPLRARRRGRGLRRVRRLRRPGERHRAQAGAVGRQRAARPGWHGARHGAVGRLPHDGGAAASRGDDGAAGHPPDRRHRRRRLAHRRARARQRVDQARRSARR